MKTEQVLIISDNPDRAAIIETGLRTAGYVNIAIHPLTADLAVNPHTLDAHVVVVDLAEAERSAAEKIFDTVRRVERPVAMFVESSSAEMVEAAIEAGVGAYVVAGLKVDRIPHVIDTAVSRFNFLERLRRERDEARTALAERKLIERAKGLLMREKGLSEEDAYAAMRRNAMKSNRKLAEIAQGIIMAYEMDV